MEVDNTSNMTGVAIAELYGVSKVTPGEWVKDHGCPRKPNKRYDLIAVIKWREGWWKVRADDAMGGGDSDNLEQYRYWKAKQAEQDYLVKAGELRPIADVRTLLTMAASHIRRAGDKLQRKCGKEAHKILDGALVQFERAVKSIVQESDDSDD